MVNQQTQQTSVRSHFGSSLQQVWLECKGCSSLTLAPGLRRCAWTLTLRDVYGASYRSRCRSYRTAGSHLWTATSWRWFRQLREPSGGVGFAALPGIGFGCLTKGAMSDLLGDSLLWLASSVAAGLRASFSALLRCRPRSLVGPPSQRPLPCACSPPRLLLTGPGDLMMLCCPHVEGIRPP